MEKRNKTIITAIFIIAVFGISAFTFLSSESQATSITNTVSNTGTKLNIQNNNNQNWLHSDLILQDVTFKNGTVGTVYIEYWVKPGESVTIDLSNALGYGTTRLPTGYSITTLDWFGLFTPNGGGTANMANSLKGWSNTADPVNPPVYPLNMASLSVGQLPSGVSGNLVIIDTSQQGIEQVIDSQYPHDDTHEQVFTEILMTVDSDGNLIMTFAIPPTICNTIAHIIS